VPTYEYHCSACDATYELRESFSAPSQHACEECKDGTARRVLSAPRIVFKGSGWYITDSRKSSSAVTGGESSEPAASDPGSTTATTVASGDSSAPAAAAG
jgi:putative FmdB family regulatory protein